MTPIILLAGNAGSGKDTFADYLIEASGGKFCKIAQADPIKRIVRDVFGATDEQLWGASHLRNTSIPIHKAECVRGLGKLTLDKALEPLIPGLYNFIKELGESATVRYLCQHIGTEIARMYQPDIWINIATSKAEQILAGHSRYDKASHVLEYNENYRYDAVIITDGRFRNEILGVQKIGGVACRIIGNTTQADQHVSETELQTIPNSWFNYLVDNKSTLNDLRNAANNLCNILIKDPPYIYNGKYPQVISIPCGDLRGKVYI